MSPAVQVPEPSAFHSARSWIASPLPDVKVTSAESTSHSASGSAALICPATSDAARTVTWIAPAPTSRAMPPP